jgi:hypothetical protein
MITPGRKKFAYREAVLHLETEKLGILLTMIVPLFLLSRRARLCVACWQ